MPRSKRNASLLGLESEWSTSRDTVAPKKQTRQATVYDVVAGIVFAFSLVSMDMC